MGLATARSAVARMRPASRLPQGWLRPPRPAAACGRVPGASPGPARTGSPAGSHSSLPRPCHPPPAAQAATTSTLAAAAPAWPRRRHQATSSVQDGVGLSAGLDGPRAAYRQPRLASGRTGHTNPTRSRGPSSSSESGGLQVPSRGPVEPRPSRPRSADASVAVRASASGIATRRAGSPRGRRVGNAARQDEAEAAAGGELVQASEVDAGLGQR